MGSAGRCYLVEDSELRLLGVEKLGVEVRRREMLCFHLRIIDVSTHDEDFQREWKVAGNTLLNLLRLGQDVLVHCRGGLGRAGTIGARLLIELGMDPATAIKHVRAARPGAIETREQENMFYLSARAKIEAGQRRWTGLKNLPGFKKMATKKPVLSW